MVKGFEIIDPNESSEKPFDLSGLKPSPNVTPKDRIIISGFVVHQQHGEQPTSVELRSCHELEDTNQEEPDSRRLHATATPSHIFPKCRVEKPGMIVVKNLADPSQDGDDRLLYVTFNSQDGDWKSGFQIPPGMVLPFYPIIFESVTIRSFSNLGIKYHVTVFPR